MSLFALGIVRYSLVCTMPLLVYLLLLFLPSSSAFLVARPFTTSNDASNRVISSFVPGGGRTQPYISSSVSMLSSVDDSSVLTEFAGFDSTGFVILAGGTGSRMKANMPKQFMILNSRPVLHYSLHLFLEKLPTCCINNNLSPPRHVVLVIDPKYQSEYQSIVTAYQGKLSFANPGIERQGSVQNGLNELVNSTNGECTYVAIHDSARPLVTIQEVCNVVHDAHITGAAVLGVPCKATIKESIDGGILVSRTLDRSKLWEVHTPQVVRVEALLRGFDKVEKERLEVTDDVSIIEALNEPVKLTRGEYTNLKITTPEDMDVASAILLDRGEEDINLAGAAGGVDGNGGISPSSSSSSPAIGGRRTQLARPFEDQSWSSRVDRSDDNDVYLGERGKDGGSDRTSSMMKATSATIRKNPFSDIPRAGHLREREYNTLREVQLTDMDYVTGRSYPQRPTPSRWHE